MLDAIPDVGDTTEKSNMVKHGLCPQGSLCNGDDRSIKRSLRDKCRKADVHRDKVTEESPAQLWGAWCTCVSGGVCVYERETESRGTREEKKQVPVPGILKLRLWDLLN